MTEGRKDDKGKARWSLMIWEALAETAEVLTIGAAHYGAHNWRDVKGNRERYFDALMRHVVAGRHGFADASSGKSHWAHVICNAMFLWWIDSSEGSAKVSPMGIESEESIFLDFRNAALSSSDDPVKAHGPKKSLDNQEKKPGRSLAGLKDEPIGPNY